MERMLRALSSFIKILQFIDRHELQKNQSGSESAFSIGISMQSRTLKLTGLTPHTGTVTDTAALLLVHRRQLTPSSPNSTLRYRSGAHNRCKPSGTEYSPLFRASVTIMPTWAFEWVLTLCFGRLLVFPSAFIRAAQPDKGLLFLSLPVSGQR